MGRKKKLKKFEELHSFPHVYENFEFQDPHLYGHNGETVELKGKWAQNHFQNENPIVLELACGGGEYTVALAERYPDKNFIGVDIKGARIWKGATQSLEKGLSNAAFLRCRIEKIADFFSAGEVSEIWITFPDPFLRESKENRRLTSAIFLQRYAHILQEGARIHLKTDDETLYQFTLETLRNYPTAKIHFSDDDIYKGPLPIPELDIKTYYESMHLAIGKRIKFVSFSI